MAKNSRPYKTTKPVTPKKKGASHKIKEKLENTTRIRIDKDRLNDTSSLDTSFLEGRVDAQSRKKVLNSKVSNKKHVDLTILRNIIVMVIFLVLLILVVLALMKHSPNESKEPTIRKVTKEKIVKMIDDNYLFVGDVHTSNLSFEGLDYHYNKMDDDYTTEDILNTMETIYSYNPSIVFIELGLNDLDKEVDDTDIITNLSEIIDNIKKNRRYATICVESVYPINTEVEGFDRDRIKESVTNERISNLNDMIKELSKDKKVEYMDVYKTLEQDNKLNEEYTDDGISLNEKGYEKVWNLIRKVVDKNGGKKD